MAGTGGAASVFTTIVAGPLKEAVYNIKIGNGGVGGAAGSHTAFGSGSPYHFRGGAVGKPKMSTEKEGDAGDWSVFGPGGDGGVPGQKGKDSPSLCAGGGGGSINSNGGKGGGGYLVVVPLPDFPRLTKLLPSLEALVAAGSPTDK